VISRENDAEQECNEYSVYTGNDKVGNYKIGP